MTDEKQPTEFLYQFDTAPHEPARFLDLAQRVWPGSQLEVSTDVSDPLRPILRVRDAFGDLLVVRHRRVFHHARAMLLALLNEDSFTKGRASAFEELQRLAAAHGGVYDAETNTVINSDELLKRMKQLREAEQEV